MPQGKLDELIAEQRKGKRQRRRARSRAITPVGRVGEAIVRGAEGLARGADLGVLKTAEGILDLGNLIAEKVGASDEFVRKGEAAAERARQRYERAREETAARTEGSTAGKVGALAGEIGVNVAEFMVPAKAGAKAAAKLAAKAAAKGGKKLGRKTALAAESLGATAGAAPLTAAQAVVDPDASTTHLAGQLAKEAGAEKIGGALDRLADSPAGAIAGDIAIDAALGGTVDAIAGGLSRNAARREARKRLRDAIGDDPTALVNDAASESAERTDFPLANAVRDKVDELRSRRARRRARKRLEEATTPLGDDITAERIRDAARGHNVPTDRFPERVQQAAIRIGDRVYVGRDHSEAAEKAVESGALRETDLEIAAELPGVEYGFVTSRREFVDRDEARPLAERARQVPPANEDLQGTGLDARELDEPKGSALDRTIAERQEAIDEDAARRFAFPMNANRIAEVAEAKNISVTEAADRLRRAGYNVTAEMTDEAHELVVRPAAEQRHLRGDRGNSRSGAASHRVIVPLGTSAIGAAGGAAIDDENRVRGAAIGAGLGLGTGALGVRALSPGQKPPPIYMHNASVKAILGTIGSGGTATPRTKLGELARRAYTRLVDEAQPLRDFGRDVDGSERLSHEVSRAKGYKGAAQLRIATDLRDVVELAKANGHEAGVRALAKAERIIERAQLGKATDPKQLHDAKMTVLQLSAVPEVRRATDALRKYYRTLLEHKLANGVITQDQFNAIVAKGHYYSPMIPTEIADARVPSAGGGKLVNRGTGVRRMTDELNTGETVNPFEQAVLDTFETERTVSKQRVTNVVSEIVEKDPALAAPFIRRVPPKYLGTDAKTGKVILTAPRGAQIVEANVKGERVYYEVLDKELYDAWAAFDPKAQHFLVRIMSPFKRALQTGVTLLPDFALANAIRDNVQASVQYAFPTGRAVAGSAAGAAAGALADEDDRLGGALKGAAFGFGMGALAPNIARTLAAMGDIIGRSADYQQWLREGGGGMSEFYGRPEHAKKLVRQMMRDKNIARTIVNPGSWVGVLQAIGRAVEEAPRVARFKAMKAAGANIPEAIHGSRDISLDFATIGKDTKGIAAVTAFFNAKVLGWDKLIRMLRNPKTWGVGAATITAPTIALWSVNKDNPEYWQVPQWERNLFWLIPDDDGGFYRIPKPFELGFIFASLPERILDYMHQRDPETLAFAMKDMGSTTGEGSFPIPTMLEPLIENIANHDFFTNRPVVSRGLERLPGELQYDQRTSSVAKGVGKVTGMSPQQIDNVLRGYTGGAGDLALNVTDRIARATGVDERALDPNKRTPIVGRFHTRPGQASDAENAVFRRFERAEKAYRAANKFLEAEDVAGFEKWMDKHGEDIAAYDQLRDARSELLKLSTARREIMARTDISDEEKREVLQFIANESHQVASRVAGPARVASADQ